MNLKNHKERRKHLIRGLYCNQTHSSLPCPIVKVKIMHGDDDSFSSSYTAKVSHSICRTLVPKYIVDELALGPGIPLPQKDFDELKGLLGQQLPQETRLIKARMRFIEGKVPFISVNFLSLPELDKIYLGRDFLDRYRVHYNNWVKVRGLCIFENEFRLAIEKKNRGRDDDKPV